MQIIRDGVAFAFDDVGDRRHPAALLIHGWAMNRSSFAPLSAGLRDSQRVVSVDLRGFGESDAPEQTYTIGGYSDDSMMLARQLGLHKPIVIGHSLGGMVALDIAARYPDQIAAAIVLEGLVAPHEDVYRGVSAMLPRVMADDYREFVSGLITHLAGPHFDPAGRATLSAIAASCRQHVLVSALRAILAFDSIEAAARVACPVLYVGTSTTYADLVQLRRLCPQLVTGQLVGCGHYFPLEVPDQLEAMVARFIRTNVPPG